jgi:hypothetical protein
VVWVWVMGARLAPRPHRSVKSSGGHHIAH